MKLEKCIKIGKEHDMESVEECVSYIELNWADYFTKENCDEELRELRSEFVKYQMNQVPVIKNSISEYLSHKRLSRACFLTRDQYHIILKALSALQLEETQMENRKKLDVLIEDMLGDFDIFSTRK